MKPIALLFIALLIFSVSATAQIHFHQAPSTYSDINLCFRTGTGAWDADTIYLTEPLLKEFESRIQRARKTNAIGIGMGSLANLTLIVNGGFLNPDDDIESYQPVFALIGLGTGVARLIISFNTIRQLNCARDALLQYVSQPGNDSLFSSTLLKLRTAKNLSVAIPVLGAGGFAFMLGGYIAYFNNNENAGDFCFAAGWICVGAGLLTSLIDQAVIARTIKSFRGEAASLELGASRDGMGICLRF